MKFEKLSENKLRIILSIKDLEEKHINFHDFMSNSLETQDLFLDMLEEAEEQVGFNTRNYRVKIEALAMTDMNFIVTITRIIPESDKTCPSTSKKKFKVKRKQTKTEAKEMIYRFNCFDDYCNFIEYLSKNNLTTASNIAKEISVYTYKNQYYLILNNIDQENISTLKFCNSIIEFGSFIHHTDLFVSKLYECGKVVIKNNAIETSLKHFSSFWGRKQKRS